MTGIKIRIIKMKMKKSKTVLLVILIMIIIALVVNSILYLYLAEGDFKLYWDLLVENKFEVIQWIYDSTDIQVYNRLNKGIIINCIGVEVWGNVGFFNACVAGL
jgi:hypothetical protein